MTANAPFRAIAEFTYDWESWIGPDGQVRWVNPAVERITGYNVAECLELAEYPLTLVFEADRPAVAEVLTRALQGGAGNHFEFRIQRKDGDIRWGAISFQPIADSAGNSLGYRSSVRDIHRHKEMEAELRAAVQRAEEANLAKTQFVANVSHELRTPLQSITGYTQLLLGGQLSPPLDGYAQVLLEQAEHLETLVDDLLDYSAMQGGALPLRIERYEPAALIERVLRGLYPLAHAKGLTLTWSLPTSRPMNGDPQRIAQVINNLVGNAVKFTTTGGVHVVATAPNNSRRLEVVVDDTGPGLPPGESLFEPFRQGQGTSGYRPGGVGLGLALSRQLCERMGGTLTAGVSPANGARFIAVFPGVEAKAVTSVARFDGAGFTAVPNASFAQSHPLTALVIDDIKPAREFLREALRALGYAPQVAGSADEGFQCAEQTAPDLVLLDIQMPGVDGWAAARGLRARLGSVPYLVALTAQSLTYATEALSEAGFNGYARKPIDMRELQSLLVRAHQHVQNRQQPLFDPQRLSELRAVQTAPNMTLLDKLRGQVQEALPAVLLRLSRAAASHDTDGVARAVHDALGLFALIGADRAKRAAIQAEAEAARGLPKAVTLQNLHRAAREVMSELDALR